jgi:hypothetical protein
VSLENSFFVDGVIRRQLLYRCPYAADAFLGFAAVWADAVAVVDKDSAVDATRLTIFAHSLLPLLK